MFIEVHHVDVSRTESYPQAILHIEDADRSMTKIPSRVLPPNVNILENVKSVDKDMLALGSEDEESNYLETMYYSDIYAISTIQPVHEVTFYATTEEVITENNTFVKQKVRDFNLIKEEMETSTQEILKTESDLATVLPRNTLI